MKLDLTREGPWQKLFPKALELMAHLERKTDNPPWSFGGGTVLMLRIGHRFSKDIDLFVPDPQYLGFVNPRLSDVAEGISTEYEENAEYIKLVLQEGEIDVVVGTPLTDEPFEFVEYQGRKFRVETNAEIIGKKFYHRGDRTKARDIFDLCAVAKADPDAIIKAAPLMTRHGEVFLRLLEEREEHLRREFKAIDAHDFRDSFEQCAELARSVVSTALGRNPGPDQNRLFVGPIVQIDEGWAYQRTGRGGQIEQHRLAVLTAPVTPGQSVEITYRGGLGIVARNVKEVAKGLER